VVVDPGWSHSAIPCWGGHGAGWRIPSASAVAALLGGAKRLLSGSSGPARGRLASIASAGLGLAAGAAAIGMGLMKAAARGRALSSSQGCGLDPLAAAGRGGRRAQAQLERGFAARQPRQGPAAAATPLLIGWGFGCERGPRASPAGYGAVDQALSEHQLAPQAVGRAGQRPIAKGRKRPAALAQQRGWPLRLFGATSLAPVAVPTPSLAVEKEMARQRREGRSPARRRTGASLAGQQTDQRAASRRLGLDVGPRRRARAGGRHLGDSPAASQWAPAQGTSTLIGSGPGSLDLLTSRRRPGPGLSTVWGGLRGSISTCLSTLRATDSGAANGQLTQERQRCCPRDPGFWPSQGLTGVPGLLRRQRHLRHGRGWPWNCGCSARTAADRASACTPASPALAAGGRPGRAPLMHDSADQASAIGSRPGHRSRGACGLRPWAICGWLSTNPRSLGRATGKLAEGLELLAEGAHHQPIPWCLGRQLGRQESRSGLCTGRRPPPRPGRHAQPWCCVWQRTTRLQGRGIVTPRGYPGA